MLLMVAPVLECRVVLVRVELLIYSVDFVAFLSGFLWQVLLVLLQDQVIDFFSDLEAIFT